MDKFRRLFGTKDPKTMASRIHWRRALASSIFNKIPFLRSVLLCGQEAHTQTLACRLALFFAGYAWMISIPLPQLGQQIYVDENALQPNQVNSILRLTQHFLIPRKVNTHWDWADVHRADLYLEQLESLRDNNASSEQWVNFHCMRHRFTFNLWSQACKLHKS
jgi:hypothetical protein